MTTTALAVRKQELNGDIWQTITAVAPVMKDSRLFGVTTAEQAMAIMAKGYEMGLTLTASFEFITVIQGNRHLLFEAGSTQLICRRLEGEFLDYKNAIPRSNSISVVVDTKNLLESLDRVSVVISEKLKSPVRCVFEEDRVLLSAKTGNGEAKDVCHLSGDGAGLEIGFNNRYLMEALRYAPADFGDDIRWVRPER